MRKLYRYIKESIILRINVYIYMAGQEVGMKKARLEIYSRLNNTLDELGVPDVVRS